MDGYLVFDTDEHLLLAVSFFVSHYESSMTLDFLLYASSQVSKVSWLNLASSTHLKTSRVIILRASISKAAIQYWPQWKSISDLWPWTHEIFYLLLLYFTLLTALNTHTHTQKLDWCFSTYHSTLKILANILKLLEFGTWTILIHINHNNNNKTKKNSIKRLSKQGRNRSVRESIWRQNGHFHILFVSCDCIILK